MVKVWAVLGLMMLFTGCGEKNNEEIVLPSTSPVIEEEQEKLPEVSPLESEPPVFVPEDTSTLSNKKIGWYFTKGKDHNQPTFGKDLTVPADKYEAIYLMPKEEKKIYLTFDEGYENGYTGQILDVLKEKNVKAVFFITGPYLEKETELVKRMVDEGHEVGNHTVNHPSMPSCSDDELEKEVL